MKSIMMHGNMYVKYYTYSNQQHKRLSLLHIGHNKVIFEMRLVLGPCSSYLYPVLMPYPTWHSNAGYQQLSTLHFTCSHFSYIYKYDTQRLFTSGGSYNLTAELMKIQCRILWLYIYRIYLHSRTA